MATSPAIGTGPVQFTDAGQQFSIPLSDLAFDPSSHIVNNWPLYGQHTAAVDAWLGYLVKNGVIYPGAAPPPTAAMVITAHTSGSAGNNIGITFSNVGTTDPTDPTKFDATLLETDTYPRLTKDTIAAALTKRPGLVTLTTATPAKPVNGQYPMSGLTKPYKVKVLAGATTTAFELTARSSADDEAKYTTVTISGVSSDPSDPMFDLTVTWQKAVIGTTATLLQGGGGTPGVFQYEIDVAPPTGASLGMPAGGTTNLRGGSEAAAATNASAIVVGG
jgi:hypothetical protein